MSKLNQDQKGTAIVCAFILGAVAFYVAGGLAIGWRGATIGALVFFGLLMIAGIVGMCNQ